MRTHNPNHICWVTLHPQPSIWKWKEQQKIQRFGELQIKEECHKPATNSRILNEWVDEWMNEWVDTWQLIKLSQRWHKFNITRFWVSSLQSAKSTMLQHEWSWCSTPAMSPIRQSRQPIWREFTWAHARQIKLQPCTANQPSANYAEHTPCKYFVCSL